MGAVLDACVLVPALTRGVLIGAARQGWFQPLWSPKIFAEWTHAAEKQSPERGAATRTEQVLLNHSFPHAEVQAPERPDLWLPDQDDIHVLSAAIAGEATEIVTANTGDFPIRILGQHRLLRRHPDEFLLELAHTHPAEMAAIATNMLTTLPPTDKPRTAFKRSGLNRLGKFLS
ncbi:MAG: PIN domain-containing protein [Pseudomonadota bacterium]